MPTYCVPTLSGVPGFPASEFDWWTLAPDATNLRFYPENPNWLTSFSLSEGAGANRHVQFRALQGTVGAQAYLFLSWVIRVSDLQTTIDRLNVVLSDGTNYVAFQVKLGSASATVAGTQNNAIFSYRIRNCAVSVADEISTTGTETSDGADIEATGRMWVDVSSPQRNLRTRWGLQVAIPLGVAWGPTTLNLPASGAFKLWYEICASVGANVTQYHPPVPTNLSAVGTTSAFQIVPSSAPLLTVGHLVDMSTSGAGCTDGVKIDWGSVGTRNVGAGDPARTDLTSIRLDLGQAYPPNMAAGGGPLYDESHTPDVSQTRYQNQFYAQPTFPAGMAVAQQESVHGRFSLANWGSQIGVGSSWSPIPGGEDPAFQSVANEIRFVFPLPGPGGTADAFTTNLVRNINKWLNAQGRGLPFPAGAQHPHQCVLVELTSTDPNVVITQSSIYQNMNVAQASVFSRLAEISVKGLAPIGPQRRDVYLYIQKFNMPPVVKEPYTPRFDLRKQMVAGYGQSEISEVEDVAAFYPTYIIHAFHDTGRTYELEDGRRIPILEPQTSFGYFATHEGSLYGWETRLYGAEKIADNLYVIRVPNNGSAYVETAIQARESASESPLPETKPTPGGGCCAALAAWLDHLGPVGHALAQIVRLICRLIGQ